MALDGAGNLALDDFYNLRIRVVAESTGTFYGQAMTAGDIYTVAGGWHQRAWVMVARPRAARCSARAA